MSDGMDLEIKEKRGTIVCATDRRKKKVIREKRKNKRCRENVPILEEHLPLHPTL